MGKIKKSIIWALLSGQVLTEQKLPNQKKENQAQDNMMYHYHSLNQDTKLSIKIIEVLSLKLMIHPLLPSSVVNHASNNSVP